MSWIYNPPKITNRRTAHVLVLGCIDYRFTEILAWFLTHIQEVHQDYNLFCLAGASLGVVQATTEFAAAHPPPIPNFPNWQQVFFDHASLALQFHDIEEIWVFDHLDCGAYKAFYDTPDSAPGVRDGDIDRQRHIDTFLTFKNDVMTNANAIAAGVDNLPVYGFLIGLDGTITKMPGTSNLAEITLEDYNKYTGFWNGVGTATLVLVFFYLLIKITNKPPTQNLNN